MTLAVRRPAEEAVMPIHDWSRVDANLFHDFHQTWTISIRNALNNGLLPKGYSALVEQHAGGLVPDVLALERRSKQETLAHCANYITVRCRLGRVVCILETVSPGSK